MTDPTLTGRPRSPVRPGWPARLWRWVEAPPAAPPPLTPRQRALLLAGFVLLVMLRLPLAWVHGRLQDEEGTIFLAFAWHRSAGEALWRPFAGYLNFGANAVTLLAARLVRGGTLSLEAAPYLTMTAALAVQSLPAILLLWGRPAWLADRRALIASLLIVAMPPLTEEVWFNTLHIQFHLALAAALILALDVPASVIGRFGQAAILVLAPLCGPGAIILLPLFILRGLVDRSAGRLAQAALLGVGSVAQLALFYSPSPMRGDHLDPATLAAVLVTRLAMLPLLTPPVATPIGWAIHDSYRGGSPIWWIAVAAAIGYFGALLRAALRGRRDPAIWLLGGGLTVAALSFGRGMIVSDPRDWFSVSSAERYDFVPLALIGLGLVTLAARRGGRRRVVLTLCCLTLVSGLVGYAGPLRDFRRGPAWPAEVAAWRLDHDHPLASWPRDWTVDLSDHDRPCPPATAAASGDTPSYCEAAWLARARAAAGRPTSPRPSPSVPPRRDRGSPSGSARPPRP